ncbi:hypothetical protein G5I_06166 [Acromyrmex echinatior]|uniref:Uncharacterized protein n=1 Tax=Acromyrmex echinatior TaxID=103372 RepID=F4WKG9_ACREC|nr:hypothetical protein G5I_06166 [Acromyrmex echinatior]
MPPFKPLPPPPVVVAAAAAAAAAAADVLMVLRDVSDRCQLYTFVARTIYIVTVIIIIAVLELIRSVLQVMGSTFINQIRARSMLLPDRNGKYSPQFERTVERPSSSSYFTLVLSGTRLTSSIPEVPCFREFGKQERCNLVFRRLLQRGINVTRVRDIERRIDVTVDMPSMSEA